MVTKSKKGGVKYKLDAGPVGMKMTPEGKITWTAPAFVPDTWSVIVSVSDASGQERFHTFTLQVAQDNTAVAKEPKVGAAPPEPVVPAAPIAPIDLVVKPAALTQDEHTVNLPSSIGQVAVGAGGRLLILHLPKDRKLAIFDTAMAKIVKYLPLAEDTVAFAAGAKSLIVLLPTANVIQRWNLATLEKEVTLPNPIPTAVKSLAMGSASHGPLVVVGTGGAGISLYDPRTLKASEYSLTALRIFHPQYPPEVRVSANGETIAAWVIGLSPSGVYIWSRQGSEYKASHQHDSYGSLLPTPDGKMVFALGRLLTPDGKPIGEVKPRSSIYIPAVQGTAWLSVEGGGDDRFGGRPAQRPRLHIHLDRDTRPLVTLNEPTGLENLASAAPRIFLVQDAKLMAIVPPSADKLVLHRFDIDAMLVKAGIDYLLVVGSPPSEAPLGGTFRYTPSVKSKKGGVKIKLDSGPEGMTLGADNTLTWAVPKDAPKEVNVILTISDATGQEVFHTFKLATKTLD